MEVFICTTGERGEGYGIRKIYSTHAKAMAWLGRQRSAALDPTEIQEVRPGHFMFTDGNGVDIYAVRNVEVE